MKYRFFLIAYPAIALAFIVIGDAAFASRVTTPAEFSDAG
jgi:hypothetical protein